MRKTKIFLVSLLALICLPLAALAQPDTPFGEGAVAESKLQAATLLKEGRL